MAPGGIPIFLLDNYDSFTWNLAQLLRELGAVVTVRRHDAVGVEDVMAGGYAGIVISPGPGRPENAGISPELAREACGRLPVLGVCLGHQAIGQIFGAKVVRAARPVHGRTSLVRHDGRGVFEGLPDPFEATRYHSLVLDPASLPPELVACAFTGEGDERAVMGVRHRDHPEIRMEGVQFHPESILTPSGRLLLRNFLSAAS